MSNTPACYLSRSPPNIRTVRTSERWLWQLMLQRIASPNLPTRDILLQTYTVVRKSCGAHLHKSLY